MTLKEILQGRFMTHPLHPATVHLPLGGWVASVLLDTAALIRPSESLTKAADYANRIALAAAVPSVASGLADYVDVEDKETFNWATLHLGLNVAVATLGLTAWKFRAEDPHAEKPSAKLAVTQAVLLGTLFVSGYVGGLMVYEKAMRVIPLEPKGAQKPQPQLEKVFEKAREKMRRLA